MLQLNMLGSTVATEAPQWYTLLSQSIQEIIILEVIIITQLD